MSEDSGGDKGIISRRGFLKLAGAGAILIGASKTGDLIQAGADAIEKSQNHATEAQRGAIKIFNQKKEEEIIHYLTTGPDGAILRSIPEPPDKATNAIKNNFVAKNWEPNKTYHLPAIKVRGADPNNSGVSGADWYFIATERDPETGKVTGGYFSYTGNFTSAPQTKG